MHFVMSTHFSTVNSKDTLLVAGNALMDQFSSTPIPTLYENKQNLLFSLCLGWDDSATHIVDTQSQDNNDKKKENK